MDRNGSDGVQTLIVKTWINTDSISAMIQLGLVNDLLRNIAGDGSSGPAE